jgi:hypothetical protein
MFLSDKSYVKVSAMEVDPPTEADDDDLKILTAEDACKWVRKWLTSADGQISVMIHWRNALHNYHFHAELTKVGDIQIWLYYEISLPYPACC